MVSEIMNKIIKTVIPRKIIIQMKITNQTNNKKFNSNNILNKDMSKRLIEVKVEI